MRTEKLRITIEYTTDRGSTDYMNKNIIEVETTEYYNERQDEYEYDTDIKKGSILTTKDYDGDMKTIKTNNVIIAHQKQYIKKIVEDELETVIIKEMNFAEY